MKTVSYKVYEIAYYSSQTIIHPYVGVATISVCSYRLFTIFQYWFFVTTYPSLETGEGFPLWCKKNISDVSDWSLQLMTETDVIDKIMTDVRDWCLEMMLVTDCGRNQRSLYQERLPQVMGINGKLVWSSTFPGSPLQSFAALYSPSQSFTVPSSTQESVKIESRVAQTRFIYSVGMLVRINQLLPPVSQNSAVLVESEIQ